MLNLDEKFVNAFSINNLEEQAYSHVLEREEVYQCESCDSLYAEMDQAQECCGPKAVYAYKCPKCSAIHIRAASAVSCCCADVDEGKIPEGIRYQLNQLYLENANQIRLF